MIDVNGMWIGIEHEKGLVLWLLLCRKSSLAHLTILQFRTQQPAMVGKCDGHIVASSITYTYISLMARKV